MNYTEIKEEALAKLQNNNWGTAILATLVVMLVGIGAAFIPFGSILVSGPIQLGVAMFYLGISRDQKMEVGQIFDGFKNFGNAIGASILMGLIIMLGIILLIIPGIIAALALSQTFRIMRDHPELGITDAMQRSHDMMKGRRGDLFLFNLSFIGWALLCILTLGLGFLVLAPYVGTSNAIYYNKIKGEFGAVQMIEEVAS